jgi:hypothetical protein
MGKPYRGKSKRGTDFTSFDALVNGVESRVTIWEEFGVNIGDCVEGDIEPKDDFKGKPSYWLSNPAIQTAPSRENGSYNNSVGRTYEAEQQQATAATRETVKAHFLECQKIAVEIAGELDCGFEPDDVRSLGISISIEVRRSNTWLGQVSVSPTSDGAIGKERAAALRVYLMEDCFGDNPDEGKQAVGSVLKAFGVKNLEDLTPQQDDHLRELFVPDQGGSDEIPF